MGTDERALRILTPKVGSRVDELLTEFSQGENEKVPALRNALSVPFCELEKYSSYVTDNTRFATHQGVKGLEFPRVMVIMDDAQARGFLFSYEKLFGAKAQSDTGVKNKREGKDPASRERHVSFTLPAREQRRVWRLLLIKKIWNRLKIQHYQTVGFQKMRFTSCRIIIFCRDFLLV